MNKVLAVIGAQYGSEGKGVIVHHLADRYDVHVRVGGPNAGHTIKHDGYVYKMRSIPCGWTNPDATLIIGRGAIINPEVLAHELGVIEVVDPSIRERLFVDADAWCVHPYDADQELQADLQGRIGSTLEGVGVARITRIKRDLALDRRAKTIFPQFGLEGLLTTDTMTTLEIARARGRNILLEGTQGAGLSLLHGPWPYVTSHDTNAAQLLADCGMAPASLTDVLLVMRSYPIRVGGNSGPLRGEIDWGYISKKFGRPMEEVTTVTGRVRRIGLWDDALIRRAVILNGANWAALTFMDYWEPTCEGKDVLTAEQEQWLRDMELIGTPPIVLAGMGGPNLTVIERIPGVL